MTIQQKVAVRRAFEDPEFKQGLVAFTHDRAIELQDQAVSDLNAATNQQELLAAVRHGAASSTYENFVAELIRTMEES